MQAVQCVPLSEADYLAFEAKSLERHEYVAGQIFAMTGSTLRHATIAGNVFALVKAHLKGSHCRAFISDVKVHVARDAAYYYPDLVVSCDEQLAKLSPDQRIIETPVLIVEVLSESTEAIDRREKMFSYRKLSSLKEYVLIAQNERRVEVFRRVADVGWEQRIYDADDRVDLASIGALLTMDDIYEESGV